MALTRTAAQLVTGARNRADQVGSNFRSDATIYGYLSASCRDLVSMLSRTDDYWNASTTVNTVASQGYSVLPTAAWKLVSLRVTLSGVRERLKRASVDELDSEVTLEGWESFGFPRYRLRGDNIVWHPKPTAVHVVTVEYLPHAIFKDTGGTPKSEITAADDTFDGVFGWQNWVELHTAIKLRSDAEKDTAALRVELAEAEGEFLRAAADRDQEEPERIRDTWRSGYEDTESDYG